MDAISFLKSDHRAVEKLFARFEKTRGEATATRRKLVDEMIVELSKHASIEERFLYPAAREVLGKDKGGEVLEALEEHHVVKWVLNELLGLSSHAERFEAKVKVLMDIVRHHVDEEETELFPALRKAMKPAQLKAIGEKLQRAKKTAPTRPHPQSPDTPPGNRMVTPVAAAMDRGRDLLKSLASRPRARKPAQPAARTVH